MNIDFNNILLFGGNSNYIDQFFSNKKIIETNLDPALFFNSNATYKIVTDDENLPFANDKFDLIISILNLHNVNDLPGCFKRLQESLKPKGVLIVSMFGEENLLQLKEVIIETELALKKGTSPRISPSISIKQLGSLMQRAGFKDPIIDCDHVIVHYKDPIDILRDLRNMGETNIMINRNKNYIGKNFWNEFSKNYRAKFSVSNEEIQVNFEILTVTAFQDSCIIKKLPTTTFSRM